MALTVTNINTLQLLNIVNRMSREQSNTLTQLSTGLRINKGSDNPAGLIALASFNMELTAVNAALMNNQRADSMLAVADSALTEVGSLLTEIESLVAAAASPGNLSPGEIAANQAQIDSAITSIDRIIRTTSFNGKRLLDGTLGIDSTGIDSTKVADLKIFSRPQGTSSIQVVSTITASATTASAALGIFDSAGTNITTSGTTELSITGTLGNAVLTIGSGQDRGEIVSLINTATAQTGISAIVNTTTNSIELTTTGFGTDEFISVDVLSGGYLSNDVGGAAEGNLIETQAKTYGKDATVTINGQTANVDGLDVFFSANGLSLQFSLPEDYGFGRTANRSDTETFNIELTGGATFQLGTESNTRSTIGLNSLASHKLGGGDSGGFLSDLRGGQAASLNNDVATAFKVVKDAISDVATERGRIGAFQKFQVQTSINSLEALKTGLTRAKSVIADTDYAFATSELNRQNVLMTTGISLLGLVNQQTAQILSLLR